MNDERPQYRHIVVWRKGFTENLEKPIPVADTARRTFQDQFGETPEEYQERDPDGFRRLNYRPQSGFIVATLTKQHIPGGNERLTSLATVRSLPVPLPENPGIKQAHEEFLKAGVALQAQFRKEADRAFILLDESMRSGVTLVTVIYSAISAHPLVDSGFQAVMEYHQRTRFGYVDTAGFEVYSEDGTYPIQAPRDEEMGYLLNPAEAVLVSQELNARRLGGST